MDSPCIKQTVCKVLKIFQYGKYLVAYVPKRGDLSSAIQKRLTTSLVVICDSVNFLLGNHMKCFNKVIFGKLIFSFKVLMYCSRENVME